MQLSRFHLTSQVPRLRWLIAGMLTMALAACGGTDTAAPVITTTLAANLSGDQEPTPTVTGALASGSLTVSDQTGALSGSIVIDGMTATAAHIHQGSTGVNGPIIVDLTQTAPGSGVWTVPANAMLTEAQRAAFTSGGLYFNAHSADNPGGEIRGQIGRQVTAAQLTAAQEVPVNTSTATGSGFVTLDPATRTIAARLVLSGMTATAAHIHSGAVGVNGPIIVDLAQTAPGSGIWVSAANAALTDAQIALLNSGGLYFNAHSAAFPGGQIRGQIGRNVGYASLNAGQEIPTNSSAATGTGTVVVDAATRVISGSIALRNINATAAHIHTGAVGANGPIIVNLVNAGGGVWNVPAGAVFTADQLKALKDGNLYFNAHSAAFPGGEIRGQINRQVTVIRMSAAQEVPTNASTASASALVSVNQTNRQLVARMTVSGMTATAAHIHSGAVGSNGPIVVNLAQTAPGSGVWVSAADARLTEADLATFRAGGMYFNAHSAAFPGGEIRGQIGGGTLPEGPAHNDDGHTH